MTIKTRDRTKLKWLEPSKESWAKMKAHHKEWLMAHYPQRISLNHLATQVFEEAVAKLR